MLCYFLRDRISSPVSRVRVTTVELRWNGDWVAFTPNNRMFYARLAIWRSQCACGYAGAETADKYSTLSFLPRGMSVRKSQRVSVILIDHRAKEKRRARGMQKGSWRRKRKRSSSTATFPTMDEFCDFFLRIVQIDRIEIDLPQKSFDPPSIIPFSIRLMRYSAWSYRDLA